jgi:hypothetical protein
VGGVLAAPAACLDATPIFVAPPDASVDDAGAETSLAEACRQCIEAPDTPGPGCGKEMQACDQLPGCKAAIECTFAAGCFTLGSASKVVVCGLPCATEAGILTGTDPAIPAATNVFNCSTTTCAPACSAGGDAGISH